MIPLLLPPKDPATEADVGLPPTVDNLFQRIIRNPRPDSRHARERECTEMLGAVLVNAPFLRGLLFNWMAELQGIAPSVVNGLQYSIRTERDIQGKRDDLRIEGLDPNDTVGRPNLLWTVEVKVGAGLHRSSRIGNGHYTQDSDDEGPDVDDAIDPELVCQIDNYDEWLVRQPHKHRGGFVLGLHDFTCKLPTSLKCKWACLSWTSLARRVESLLAGTDVPTDEKWLARHFAGFIRANLWRELDVDNPKLDFNDVAFIRAMSLMGKTCEQKLDALVSSLKPVVEASGIGVGPIAHDQVLFKSMTRSAIRQSLVRERNRKSPYLMVSIGAWNGDDYVAVWIETPPNHPSKLDIRHAIALKAEKLRRADENWYVAPTDDELEEWQDIELTRPLSAILSADDQLDELKRFTTRALNGLRTSGVIDAIRSVFTRARKANIGKARKTSGV